MKLFFLFSSLLRGPWLFIFPALVLAHPRATFSQEPLRFSQATIAATNLTLAWNSASQFYLVQTTHSLSPSDWRAAVLTTNRQVTIPLTPGAAFFRVLANVPAPPADNSVAPQRRLEILDAINQKVASLPGDDPRSDSAGVLKLLVSFPEISDAGMSADTSLFATFRDGRPFIIFNNRVADLPTNNSPAGAQLQSSESLASLVLSRASRPDPDAPRSFGARAQSSASPTPTRLPTSQRAVLLKATMPDIKAPILDSLVPAFRNRKYEVSSGEASLPGLMNVKTFGNDIGVFYIDTHGGTGRVQTVTINRQTGDQVYGYAPFYAMASSTLVNAENDLLYKENLDNLEIAPCALGTRALKGIARDNTPPIKLVPYYCILSRFVNRYWRFGQNSLVYADTCHSGNDGAPDFIEACIQSGAAFYQGWSKSVQDRAAFQSTQVFFDALLGGSEIIKIQPAQRPFNRRLVLEYLRRSGFDTDPDPEPVGGARLVSFENSLSISGEFGALAPSIQSMHVDEKTGELQIFGSFDPTAPVTVRIEGNGTKEISTTAFVIPGAAGQPEPTEIICPLPSTGQPSAGSVTVIQHGRSSNVVPLSEWHVAGRLTKYFAVATPNPSASYDFNLHLRTDLHPSRRLPYQPSTFFGNSASAADGSTCSLTDASGVYNDPNGIRTVEWTVASGGPISRLVDVPANGNNTGFTGNASFGADGSLYFTVAASVKDGINVTEKTVSSITGGFVANTQPSNPFTRTFSGNGRNGVWDRTSFSIPSGEGSNAGDAGRTTWQTATTPFSPTPPGYAE